MLTLFSDKLLKYRVLGNKYEIIIHIFENNVISHNIWFIPRGIDRNRLRSAPPAVEPVSWLHYLRPADLANSA